MAKKKAPKEVWSVPVKVTLRGYALVEAASMEEAELLVANGGFDIEPGAEMSDWEQTGRPQVDR